MQQMTKRKEVEKTRIYIKKYLVDMVRDRFPTLVGYSDSEVVEYALSFQLNSTPQPKILQPVTSAISQPNETEEDEYVDINDELD
jgi:hypothetical protein